MVNEVIGIEAEQVIAEVLVEPTPILSELLAHTSGEQQLGAVQIPDNQRCSAGVDVCDSYGRADGTSLLLTVLVHHIVSSVRQSLYS
jgi:hypothetical protein